MWENMAEYRNRILAEKNWHYGSQSISNFLLLLVLDKGDLSVIGHDCIIKDTYV